MEEFVYGALVVVLATAIEPQGIGKFRWWAAMLSISALVGALSN